MTAPRITDARSGVSFGAALGLAMGVWFARSSVTGADFPLDDAWIHLSYARSLGLGDGLSYNPGDRETGFSSPLWVVLLVPFVGAPWVVTGVKLLGAVLHAATSACAAGLAGDLAHERQRDPARARAAALVAGGLAATEPSLLKGASSGMEVALAAALLVACLWAWQRGRMRAAVAAAALAELARPEALAMIGVVALVRASSQRRARELAPAAGAAGALAVWAAYCLAVSGHPWPNTAYVKVGRASVSGAWAYLQAQVFPELPWLAGVGGLLLIIAGLVGDRWGLRRAAFARWVAWDASARVTGHAPLALALGWLGAVAATAMSRPLNPQVLFYQSRYFAVFAALPAVLVALGAARLRCGAAAALIAPVALLSAAQLHSAAAVQREQSRGVALLHTGVARALAAALPRGAAVAVEGAGATRYFTPRTMRVVDVIGLNDRLVAHARTPADRACAVMARRPDFFVLPEHMAAQFDRVFEFRPRAVFVDPRWAQIETPRVLRVFVLEVLGARSPWRARCARGSRAGG